MDIPEKELDKLNNYASDSRAGIFPIDAAALYAIKLIIEYDNCKYIDVMPSNVKDAIFRMMETWRREGAFIVYFDKGSADHSHLLAKLATKLYKENE